ncbi:MAG: hypothetical protein RL748_307 [Pseudomonadota bacterium]
MREFFLLPAHPASANAVCRLDDSSAKQLQPARLAGRVQEGLEGSLKANFAMEDWYNIDDGSPTQRACDMRAAIAPFVLR